MLRIGVQEIVSPSVCHAYFSAKNRTVHFKLSGIDNRGWGVDAIPKLSTDSGELLLSSSLSQTLPGKTAVYALVSRFSSNFLKGTTAASWHLQT